MIALGGEQPSTDINIRILYRFLRRKLYFYLSPRIFNNSATYKTKILVLFNFIYFLPEVNFVPLPLPPRLLVPPESALLELL